MSGRSVDLFLYHSVLRKSIGEYSGNVLSFVSQKTNLSGSTLRGYFLHYCKNRGIKTSKMYLMVENFNKPKKRFGGFYMISRRYDLIDHNGILVAR
jgi:hypothetical protein